MRTKQTKRKQIWDDSALIDSWNSALEEYQYYHSLAAQGLDVDQVLDRAEEREEQGLEVDLMLDRRELGDGGVEEGEVDEGAVDGDGDGDAETADYNEGEEGEEGEDEGREGGNGGNENENANEQDQVLANVKMAYYWAGYYSGLYDAQKKKRRRSDTSPREQS
ncbi:hypothetical protein DV738_g2834, partial [Chaetothyriales sp. CBS 135597]